MPPRTCASNVAEHFGARQFAFDREHRRDGRIEVRPRDRTEHGDEHDEDGACRDGIAEQCNGHVASSEAFPHDAGSDDRGEQYCGADELGPQTLVQGVRCHCLSIRVATPDGGEAIFQRQAIERLERQSQKDADALAQHPHCVGESQPSLGLAALCRRETARGKAALSFDACLFSRAANPGAATKASPHSSGRPWQHSSVR